MIEILLATTFVYSKGIKNLQVSFSKLADHTLLLSVANMPLNIES